MLKDCIRKYKLYKIHNEMYFARKFKLLTEIIIIGKNQHIVWFSIRSLDFTQIYNCFTMKIQFDIYFIT